MSICVSGIITSRQAPAAAAVFEGSMTALDIDKGKFAEGMRWASVPACVAGIIARKDGVGRQRPADDQRAGLAAGIPLVQHHLTGRYQKLSTSKPVNKGALIGWYWGLERPTGQLAHKPHLDVN